MGGIFDAVIGEGFAGACPVFVGEASESVVHDVKNGASVNLDILVERLVLDH